ncbi:hypothetical protein CD932_10550 [Janthinobacterium sp. PC23-8]|nr:hypothetical protein CD932_10550 [Janthinobacterium sp. PC23-8]
MRGGIDSINAGRDVPILVRQVKYLNNIVRQDHRAITVRYRRRRCNVVAVQFERRSAVPGKLRRLITNRRHRHTPPA